MPYRESGERHFTRRTLVGTSIGTLAGLSVSRALASGTPPAVASPASPWTYEDVLGKKVSLPVRPSRIAANLVTAAALWDLGIRVVAVFDSTASAYPDGNHIAWGNIDASAVTNVGDVDGNILPETLLTVRPDVILTLTFDRTDPSQINGVPGDLADAIERIAPVLVVTDMDSTEIQLQRLVDLGAGLGADLEAAAIVESKAAYEAKVDEFRAVVTEKRDLTVLFIDFDPGELYVGGPRGVSELQFLDNLGLPFANAESDAAGEFWETLSAEQALKYPADVIYNDVYSGLRTEEELQTVAVYAAMPAIAAGQLGQWQRDFPVSYAGVADFLEVVLATLRTAEKVTSADS
ncbi:MAG TPA: ABC transporter substrate-binding protein [Thermomicrobiales bacterium]|nr:ABC transporter substrate-binding protein [Thermomicrobiales bacterium]